MHCNILPLRGKAVYGIVQRMVYGDRFALADMGDGSRQRLRLQGMGEGYLDLLEGATEMA
jgi:hypothetical protein